MMSVIGSAAFLQCESKFRLRDASRRELHAQIHVDVIRSVPENLERVFENLIVQEVRRHDHGRTMWLPHQVSLILIIVVVISSSSRRCWLQLFERVLFLYTMEHHEGNYWQGLNDLVIPFICTFVARVFDCTVEALNSLKSDAFAHILFKSEVEADIYWCLTHYVNAIQVRRISLSQPHPQLDALCAYAGGLTCAPDRFIRRRQEWLRLAKHHDGTLQERAADQESYVYHQRCCWLIVARNLTTTTTDDASYVGS